MKKYIQSERVKRYSRKTSARVLKKKRKAEEERRKYNKWRNRRRLDGIEVNQYARQKPSSNFEDYPAPENFSLRSNVDEVVLFFSKLIKALGKGDAIKIDIANVKDISSDVILYLLSILDMFKQKGGVWRVRGNAPKDERCRELFIESGFYKYVNSRMPDSLSGDNFLSIQTNTLADGSFAKKVIDFSVQHLGAGKSLITRKIYGTLMACMANTRNHAYGDNVVETRWWATALYDEKNKKVSFTFLDNGIGIPKTVKKNWTEMVLAKDDNELITSALMGEIRTRTNKFWRGKGLPSINDYSQKGIIKNLVIISSKGYINYETNERRDLGESFHGTLLSWDFIEKV